MSIRILYVEDDAVNRRVMSAMLGTSDVELSEAEDGLEGLIAIDKFDYDIILMDLRMPNMDGLTAMRHIRARDDAKSSIPIIAVTADAHESARLKCVAAGANDVMSKPFRLKELFGAIAAALVGKPQEAAAAASSGQ